MGTTEKIFIWEKTQNGTKLKESKKIAATSQIIKVLHKGKHKVVRRGYAVQVTSSQNYKRIDYEGIKVILSYYEGVIKFYAWFKGLEANSEDLFAALKAVNVGEKMSAKFSSIIEKVVML